MRSNVVGVVLVALSVGCGDAHSTNPALALPTQAAKEAVPELIVADPVANELPSADNPPNLLAGISYEIIKQDVIPNVKRSVDVRLKRRVPEDVLIKIALAVKGAESNTFERTFIGYYLPYHKPNDIYWATTNFNPELEVRIIGMKADDAKKLTEPSSDADRTEIGRWLDESSFHKRVTIFRKNGTLFMEDAYDDGSGNIQEIRSKAVPLGVRFDKLTKSPAGDHWILDSSGNLQIHDNEGLIYVAQKLE